MKRALISWGLLLACNLMWALQFTCIKLTQDQVGPYFTVWAPMLLSVIFLLPFAIRDYKKNKKRAKDMLVFVQISLLGGFPAQILMTWGTRYSLATNAAIISLCLPVVTAVLAFIFLKEKMNSIRWISFIIAIVGVIICSTSDIKGLDFGPKYEIGNLLVFLSIVGSAYYNVTCKKVIHKYTGIELVFYPYIVTVTVLTPLVLYYEPGIFSLIPDFTVQTWIGMGLLTIFQNFLSALLFLVALRFLDAIQVALSNYLITFFGLPIAVIWLGETLNILTIGGGVLIFVSTLIITILDYRMTRRNSLMELTYNKEKIKI